MGNLLTKDCYQGAGMDVQLEAYLQGPKFLAKVCRIIEIAIQIIIDFGPNPVQPSAEETVPTEYSQAHILHTFQIRARQSQTFANQ